MPAAALAVGDRVRFLPGNNGCGLIVEVLPRRSRLSRCEATGPFERHAREQVMVANLDQVIPVMAAAQPEPSWNLLDRYLVSAASLDLPAVICITKLDLARANSNLLDALGEYHRIGYTVVLTSTQTGEGIAELCSHLQGKLSVFMGKSGVGKTTLLNAIQPGLGLRVGEVSGVTGKGRHTTTRLEMFPLDCGGHVVDTPGMREFGLWGVEELDLALLFPEMKPLVGACRFGLDCSHTHEPGCAILKAVKKGAISERRYESMIHLGEE